MNENELQTLIDEAQPPFTITTKSGWSYQITDRANIWVPPNFKEVMCLVPRGKGIIFVRVKDIESLQTEHDTRPDYLGTVRHWTENR
jgi:hypothetical protein